MLHQEEIAGTKGVMRTRK